MNNNNELEQLRVQVLQTIGSMTDILAEDENIDYSTLLTLARTSGKAALLSTAYQKILKIEDAHDKSEALMELLDAVETELSFGQEPQAQIDVANSAEPPTEETQSDEQAQSGEVQQQPES